MNIITYISIFYHVKYCPFISIIIANSKKTLISPAIISKCDPPFYVINFMNNPERIEIIMLFWHFKFPTKLFYNFFPQ